MDPPFAICAFQSVLPLQACSYFLGHSFHDRVQGNWPSFLYPAIAILAAAAYLTLPKHAVVVKLSRRLAIPVAVMLTGLIYAQALFGIVHSRDPVSRLLAYGIDGVASDIDGLRTEEGAAAIVTTNYTLTGWLAFYLPGHPTVLQLNERFRYLNDPAPDPRLFRAPLIYVSQVRNERIDYLRSRFTHVVPLAHVMRLRNGAKLDEYAVFRLDGPKGDVLGFGS